MTPLDSIIAFLGRNWEDTRQLIRAALRSDIRLLNEVNESLLSRSGKMVRPMLCLLVAGACSEGGINADSCRFAAASELLHNATLLHDDVVDGGCERRGLPTVRSVLGGPASVLIGDFWLVKAMETILSADKYSERVIRIFAKTLSDLAEGEMLQLQKTGTGDTTEEDYYRIIYSKTASLFEASAVAGAVSAEASAAWREAVAKYAVALGTAFQIRDDMLDYADGGDIGKPVGMDLREQKITLPLLGALHGSPREAEIRRRVCEIYEHPEYADEIRAFVQERGGLAYARKKLDLFVGRAVEAIRPLRDSQEKTYLIEEAYFVGSRQS